MRVSVKIQEVRFSITREHLSGSEIAFMIAYPRISKM